MPRMFWIGLGTGLILSNQTKLALIGAGLILAVCLFSILCEARPKRMIEW